jgi:hypothetical protein
MKKVVFFALLLILSFGVVTSSYAGGGGSEFFERKAFLMSGEFIIYVPFDFIAPTSNCGDVKTYAYIPSYSGYASAHWQEVAPGEQVPYDNIGVFKLKIADNNNGCSKEFSFEGEPIDPYGAWEGRDIYAEDLGNFVKGAEVSKDFFNFPVGSNRISYVMAYPRYGMKNTLYELVKAAGNGNSGIQPGGSTLVGAIVPNERGFLSRVIFYPKNLDMSEKILNKVSKNIIINDDQFVVLIYKKN